MNEKTEKALHIMELALAISTETAHDVFIDYSPHVNIVTVRIFIGGWYVAADPQKRISCSLAKDEDTTYYSCPDTTIAELECLYKHGKLREEAET